MSPQVNTFRTPCHRFSAKLATWAFQPKLENAIPVRTIKPPSATFDPPCQETPRSKDPFTPRSSPPTQCGSTRPPQSIGSLQGKIVLLDFCTYCCINCLHVLPELKALEAKYPEELVVIGVHSAKFTNERETAAIQQAIQRYDIRHPVINDRDFTIWEQYGIRAWPSFMLINPIGRIIGTQSGEGIYKVFDTIIQRTIDYFDRQGAIKRSRMPEIAGVEHTSPLRYPGKVHADERRKQLFISDSGNNRVLITDLDGRVQDTI